MIRGCSTPENREKEQNLLIEWGKFRSMGEGFAFVGSDVKNLLFFSELVGRGRFRLFRQFLFGSGSSESALID
jgi:hypothetical protein